MTWWNRLISVAHPDPHVRRRGRLLATVLLIITAVTVVSIPLVLFSPNPVVGATVIVVSLAIFVASFALARRGLVSGGGWLLLLSMILSITVSLAGGSPLTALFFLVLPVVAASLILPAAQSWWVLLVALVAAGAALVPRSAALGTPEGRETVVFALLLLVAATFLASLGARAMGRALREAEANAAEAAAARARAEEHARDLAAQAEALRRTEQQLHDLVGTLETPAVTLADGVLLAPLIGSIDSRRAQALTERLLETIAARRVRLLILEVAGVSLIDTAVAHSLLQITRAVRLLGCRVVLTGIAPGVAVTLTQLGADLGGVETARSPQEVLAALAAPAGGRPA